MDSAADRQPGHSCHWMSGLMISVVAPSPTKTRYGGPDYSGNTPVDR
jgi:hypothetical protein